MTSLKLINLDNNPFDEALQQAYEGGYVLDYLLQLGEQG